MKYFDNEIELRINDQPLDILPTEFSFLLKDSIYDIFNTANFSFHDVSGLLQESFLLTEGIDIEISYGQEKNINKCRYVIIRDELDSPEKVGLMSGVIELKLVHKWYDEQEIRSTAYDKKISTIIQSLAQTYIQGFKKLDIESTVNDNIWYQPLITDSQFINEVLLPNAYSYSSNETPFYCYITNDNIFHLKNAKQMFESNSIDKFVFGIDRANNTKATTIMDLKRWKKGTYLYRNLHHRLIFKLNKDTGALETKDDYLTDHPITGSNILPVIIDSDRITGFFDVGYTHSTSGGSENLSGQVNSSMRESIFLERFLISVPFYPKLKSGNAIDIEIFMMTDTNESSLSSNYSGKYVIEECTHIWNGKDNRAYTQLLIARKYVNIPENYKLKEKLR